MKNSPPTSGRMRNPRDITVDKKPHFTDEEIATRRVDFLRMIGGLDTNVIEKFMQSLRDGEVNHWFTEKDVFSVLAKASGTTRENVLDSLKENGYRSSDGDMTEHWFKQIGAPFNLCGFSQLTVEWCNSLLQAMTPVQKPPSIGRYRPKRKNRRILLAEAA